MTAYRPGQLYEGRDGDLLFVILPGDDVEFVTNRGTRVPLAEAERVYAPLTLLRPVGSEAPDLNRHGGDSCEECETTGRNCIAHGGRPGIAPVYPAPGSEIPDMPGYVVGECTHRVAASEWRAGFRTCERCGSDWEDPGTGADFYACDHKTTDEPGHDPKVCPRISEEQWQAVMDDSAEQAGGSR